MLHMRRAAAAKAVVAVPTREATPIQEMRALGTKRVAKRLDRLQNTVRLLAEQIQAGEDSSAILRRAEALARLAKELHADLIRDCLTQALTSPKQSGADTERLLQELTKLLR